MFTPLPAPIVGSALLGVIFCLDSGPFFFLIMFPSWVFFLYLFIYLFVALYLIWQAWGRMDVQVNFNVENYI
jgi:hypothetical protein